jgi:hypothetical protein
MSEGNYEKPQDGWSLGLRFDLKTSRMCSRSASHLAARVGGRFYTEIGICLNVMYYFSLGFEVLMVASMKVAVFWVVAPCSLVEVTLKPEPLHSCDGWKGRRLKEICRLNYFN